MKRTNHGAIEPWFSLFLQTVVGSGHYDKEKTVQHAAEEWSKMDDGMVVSVINAEGAEYKNNQLRDRGDFGKNSGRSMSMASRRLSN